LRHAAHVSMVSADNKDYYCGVTIGDALAAADALTALSAELAQARTALTDAGIPAEYRHGQRVTIACERLTALSASHEALTQERDAANGAASMWRDWLAKEKARAEAAEAALAAEHETSRNDPVEQRAERYAMEAMELAGKLAAAEAQVAALTAALQDLDAEPTGAAPGAPKRNRHEKWGPSPLCQKGEHEWCMNRTPEECHCGCECHVKVTPPASEMCSRGAALAAAEAQVAALTAPPRTPYESGLCCMAAHANAVPPWTCACPCHARQED
jgi:uncharacterized protein involved in type VI secretion and phage assembly